MNSSKIKKNERTTTVIVYAMRPRLLVWGVNSPPDDPVQCKQEKEVEGKIVENCFHDFVHG
jgi:hypothetical protein